jgi:hypothetical protein
MAHTRLQRGNNGLDRVVLDFLDVDDDHGEIVGLGLGLGYYCSDEIGSI